MRYRSKLVRNSLYVGFAQFVQLLCNLVLTPFIIHTVGLTQFGIWAVFSAITSIFLLLDLGLTASYLKFISQYYAQKDFDRLNSVINSGFVFNVAFYGPILLVSYAWRRSFYNLLNIGPAVFSDTDVIFAGILLVVFVTMAGSSYVAVIQSIQRLEFFSTIRTVALLLKTVLIFFLLSRGLELKGLLLGELFYVCAVSLSSIYCGIRCVPSMRISLLLFRLQELREMIYYGVTLQVSQVANLVNRQTDKLLLSNLLNPGSVSLYQVAQQIASLLRLVTSFVLPVVLPAASELTAQSDRKGLIELCTKGLRYVSLISFSLAGYTWACADQIVVFWLGSTEFGDSITALRWLIAVSMITPLTGFLATVARGIGAVEYEMRSSLLLIVVQLPLNLFLISVYGVVGAAVGVTMAVLASTIYFVIQFQKTTHILEVPEISKFSFRLMLAVTSCILLIQFLDPYVPTALFANRITGGPILLGELLLYYLILLGSLYFLKCIDREDLSILLDLYEFAFGKKE